MHETHLAFIVSETMHMAFIYKSNTIENNCRAHFPVGGEASALLKNYTPTVNQITKEHKFRKRSV